MMRAAVERNVGIIGEAMLRLERTDPVRAARIRGYRAAIAARNGLDHRFEGTDDFPMWEYIRDSLPTLRHDAGLL